MDLLVEFDPNQRPGLVGLHEFENELSELFGGRRIDAVNPRYLNRHRIVHDYMHVDFDIVWDVITRDLERLVAKLRRLA